MSSIIMAIIATGLALVFLILWLRARRAAADAEVVAYGLRAQDESDENTKTSISIMEAEYEAAIERLSSMGEIKRDDWGRWVWVKTGEQLGDN